MVTLTSLHFEIGLSRNYFSLAVRPFLLLMFSSDPQLCLLDSWMARPKKKQGERKSLSWRIRCAEGKRSAEHFWSRSGFDLQLTFGFAPRSEFYLEVPLTILTRSNCLLCPFARYCEPIWPPDVSILRMISRDMTNGLAQSHRVWLVCTGFRCCYKCINKTIAFIRLRPEYERVLNSDRNDLDAAAGPGRCCVYSKLMRF